MAAVVALASCGRGHAGSGMLPAGNAASPGTPQSGGLTAARMNADFPKSVSPHSIVPKAMPIATRLPSSAMDGLTTRTRRRMSLGALSWTQLPGAATSVAISKSDGSLWALSTQPAGSNKYIWHYNGAWTNVPGLAASIAVDPNGDVYAVNSATGGVYELASKDALSNTPNWVSLGGGAVSVTAGVNEEAYVLSNSGITSGNSAIWKYAAGAWTQMPGAGSQIAGSFDLNTHTVGGLTMNPDGFFVLNSSGGIYYYSPTVGYIQFPDAASSIGPSTGGVFALAYPASPNGEQVYYYDYSTNEWSSQAGSGVALAANGGIGGAAPQLYLINAGNQIWTTVSQTVPFTVTIAAAPGDDAQTNTPKMNPANTYIYVMGQLPPATNPVQWVYLTNAAGAEAPFTGTVTPILFYGGSTTSGNSSQTIQLPPLFSARIYISNGPLSITSTSGPAPWYNDGSQNTSFDIVEYTWPSTIGIFNVDTTQVNAMGLAMSFNLVGQQTQTAGFLAGAVTQVDDAILALPSPKPSGNPWGTLASSQWPYRVLSPDGAFTNAMFLDQQIQTEWDTFKTTWITVDPSVSGAGIPLYGHVDSSENMNFYTSESTAGAPYATIPDPFPTVGASPNPYGFTLGATQYMVQQDGPFLLPASAGSGSWPGNAANAGVAANIGNVISTALNRGILGSSVTCPPPSPIFPATAAYENQYAAAIWNVAKNPQYGYGEAYNLPYADQCNLSTDKSDAAPQSLSVTVHQS